jgi:hypothetical protein
MIQRFNFRAKSIEAHIITSAQQSQQFAILLQFWLVFTIIIMFDGGGFNEIGELFAVVVVEVFHGIGCRLLSSMLDGEVVQKIWFIIRLALLRGVASMHIKRASLLIIINIMPTISK